MTLALTTVGRSEQNVIELLDPKLSRFHCEIERRREGHTVRDCSSRNGTLVNGEAVSTPRLLDDGDRIKIGRTIMTFCRSRPKGMRSDPVVELEPGAEVGTETTLRVAQRRPTEVRLRLDRRQTQVLPAPLASVEKPWRFMARVSVEIMDAKNRDQLLALAVASARTLFQARGALVVLGHSPEAMIVGAELGIDDRDVERCLDTAGRVLTAKKMIGEGRNVLGVPVGSEKTIVGALVLCDLAASPADGSPPYVLLRALADLVGRTLTGGLSLEEVRREERAADARRIAQDLRTLIRPDPDREIAGLKVGFGTSYSNEVGSGVWDRIQGPSRAGRQEVYFALGDVPDADAPEPTRGLRRRGERSFVSLLGQAELRGALRSMIEVLPRTSDLLVELNKAVLREGCVSRLSLALCRYDPQAGILRVSGAGHEPLLIRRNSGEVESVPSTAPALGTSDDLQVAEQDLRLEPEDQLLLTSAACSRAIKYESLPSLFERLGDVAHSPTQVVARILSSLTSIPLTGEQDEGTMLLLRRV